MAVAIRAITRVQDADDAPALGAGQDGYALTWNNATGAFVATALFTGGLLATGATTGATSQAQTFTNGIIGPSWKPAADSTTALQLQTSGGANVLNVDTTNSRVGIGTNAPQSALDVIGQIRAQAPATNSASMLFLNSAGNLVSSFCSYAGWVGSGSQTDAAIGAYGANFHFFTNGSATASLVLAANGLVGIGTTAPATILHAVSTTATTNAVRNVLTLGSNVTSTGVGAAGLGAAVLFTAESTTTVDTTLARVQALWYEATHATFKGDLVLTAYDAGGEREGLRIRGAGSAPAIGFYGVAPIERAVLATGAGATVDNVITALQNLGLVKQS